jgi:membrane protease YdiL (CAAX protease family)
MKILKAEHVLPTHKAPLLRRMGNTLYASAKKVSETSWRCIKNTSSYVLNNVERGTSVGMAWVLPSLFLANELNGSIPSKELSGSTTQHVQAVLNLDLKKLSILCLQEEFVFRGMIQGIIKCLAQKHLGKKNLDKVSSLVVIVASSILFGIAHSSTGMGEAKVISTAITGMVLGMLREKSGFLSSVVAHITFNALTIKLAMLGKEGLD